MTPDETNVTPSRRLADTDTAEAVVEAWSRLLSYLVIATVVGVTVVFPFFGLLLALAAASYLRAGDLHARRHEGGSLLRLLAGPLTVPLDLVRGTAGTLVSLPYAAVFAVAVPLLIMTAAVVHVQVAPLVGAAWGAGAAAYVVLAAPGVRAPRRQMVRVFTAFADQPRRIAVAGVLLCVLALVAVAGAIVLQPRFSPIYELKNSIAQQLSQFQHSARRHMS
jgi:eukaryotic-like serine/threonine-protein kinase